VFSTSICFLRLAWRWGEKILCFFCFCFLGYFFFLLPSLFLPLLIRTVLFGLANTTHTRKLPNTRKHFSERIFSSLGCTTVSVVFFFPLFLFFFFQNLAHKAQRKLVVFDSFVVFTRFLFFGLFLSHFLLASYAAGLCSLCPFGFFCSQLERRRRSSRQETNQPGFVGKQQT